MNNDDMKDMVKNFKSPFPEVWGSASIGSWTSQSVEVVCRYISVDDFWINPVAQKMLRFIKETNLEPQDFEFVLVDSEMLGLNGEIAISDVFLEAKNRSFVPCLDNVAPALFYKNHESIDDDLIWVANLVPAGHYFVMFGLSRNALGSLIMMNRRVMMDTPIDPLDKFLFALS